VLSVIVKHLDVGSHLNIYGIHGLENVENETFVKNRNILGFYNSEQRSIL